MCNTGSRPGDFSVDEMPADPGRARSLWKTRLTHGGGVIHSGGAYGIPSLLAGHVACSSPDVRRRRGARGRRAGGMTAWRGPLGGLLSAEGVKESRRIVFLWFSRGCRWGRAVHLMAAGLRYAGRGDRAGPPASSGFFGRRLGLTAFCYCSASGRERLHCPYIPIPPRLTLAMELFVCSSRSR